MLHPYAYGYGLALALDAELGANSASHPAKHATERAAIAAKTGITGGPPTHKATGNSSVATGKLVPSSGSTWPSKDAKLARDTDWKGLAKRPDSDPEKQEALKTARENVSRWKRVLKEYDPMKMSGRPSSGGTYKQQYERELRDWEYTLNLIEGRG